jgi:hypothetical protein
VIARIYRVLPAVAGPVAIVAAVLLIDRDLAFRGLITNQHGDILSLVLPQYCLLGKSLASGHVPAWNPYLLSGTRFAGDPQSGWMYLPAMLLFSVLSCSAAIRWYVVLQPILAGLGIYAFLRSERLPRPACSVGGIALALVTADSYLGLSLATSSAVAWTALSLAATSRFLRSSTWPARIGWGLLVAGAWGQLAGSYMSTGLTVGTAGILAFLLARTVADVMSGRRRPLEALGAAAFLVAILFPVNLAVFLPRIAYLPHTTVGFGYGRLFALSHRLVRWPPMLIPAGAQPSWPLGLAHAPGSYLGAVTLALSPAALWSRRYRGLAVAFAVYGAVLYALSLHATAMWVYHHASALPLADQYLHDPGRLRYFFVLPMAVLGGIGLSAWLEDRTWRQRALMLVPAVVAFGILPGVTGLPGRYSVLFVVAGIVVPLILFGVARFPRAVALVPILLLGELVAGGLAGQSSAFVTNGYQKGFSLDGTFYAFERPAIDAAAYTAPDALAGYLSTHDGHVLSYDGALVSRVGYLVWQRPGFWGLEANERSMLFHFQDVQGYDSVQPFRYWRLVRTVQHASLVYNVAALRDPSARLMDLLGVRWVVGPADPPPLPGLVPVLREGRWELYRRPAPAPTAAVFTRWSAAPNAAAALGSVTGAGFDPNSSLVVESAGGSASAAPAGGASPAAFRIMGTQQEIVDAAAPAPGMLLIRNQWDGDWHARVDGRPAPVLRADYAFQAVPIPAGRHTVVVFFDDPSVGLGLVLSALVLVLLGGAAAVLRLRQVRYTRTPPITRPE